MLITDKLIYFELHKTGCTHTREILKSMYGDEVKVVKKHNTCHSVPKQVLGDFENKIKIGNIRNPWDWYVSLWSFGCQKSGGLYKGLILYKPHFLFYRKRHLELTKLFIEGKKPRLDIRLWKELYSDPTNYDNFRAWLKLILTSQSHGIGEGYKTSSLSQFAGLLTFRYLKFYAPKNETIFQSLDDLHAFDKRENFVNAMIRTESLHDDLLALCDQLNYDKEKLEKILEDFQSRTYASKRDSDYRKYYDDETASLVEKYETLIIQKHHYQFG